MSSNLAILRCLFVSDFKITGGASGMVRTCRSSYPKLLFDPKSKYRRKPNIFTGLSNLVLMRMTALAR